MKLLEVVPLTVQQSARLTVGGGILTTLLFLIVSIAITVAVILHAERNGHHKTALAFGIYGFVSTLWVLFHGS